jgi:type II secretory pathway component PulJ
MTFPSAIVAIVAILAWAYLRSTRRQEQGGHPPASLPANPALEREIMELRKRIEVLERIITDNRETHRLAQDIEALRE